MILKCLYFVSLLCAAIYDVNGLSISDDIKTNKDMAYLGRYVFAPNENSVFEYDIKFPVPAEFSESDNDHEKAESVQSVPTVDNDGPIPVMPNIGGTSVPANVGVMIEHNPPTKEKDIIPYYKLIMYNDEPYQWPYVRDNDDKLSCKQRQKVATEGGMVVIKLDANTNPALCKRFTNQDGKPWVHCRGLRSWTEYDRPRWWFATLQNCGSHPVPGIDALVNITMTNGQGSALDFLKQFSADKTWLLPTNVCALMVLTGMLVITAIFCRILANSKLLHTTFKLYVVSVVLDWLALCFLVAGQVDFAKDGVDNTPNRTIFGHVLSWFGSINFALVVILVGKGYTVTRGRISTTGCIKLTIYTIFYCISYVAVYLYVYVLADQRDTMYLYDSSAGYLLIALRIVGAFWLTYAVAFTIKHYPAKRRFYFLYNVLFGGWFLAEPILIAVTNSLFEAHNRAQAVNAGYWAITLAGHVFWLGLFVPCDTNHNFPYHIRTCQIGFYDGDSTSDQANKYSVDIADDFTGVCVEPKERKPGAPISPKVNNFFPDNFVNTETTSSQKPNYAIFLASNAANIPRTNNDNANPKPKKTVRDTPIGKMIEMKTDYSIFQADGFVTAQLVAPGDDGPSPADANHETNAQADQFVSVQMED